MKMRGILAIAVILIVAAAVISVTGLNSRSDEPATGEIVIHIEQIGTGLEAVATMQFGGVTMGEQMMLSLGQSIRTCDFNGQLIDQSVTGIYQDASYRIWGNANIKATGTNIQSIVSSVVVFGGWAGPMVNGVPNQDRFLVHTGSGSPIEAKWSNQLVLGQTVTFNQANLGEQYKFSKYMDPDTPLVQTTLKGTQLDGLCLALSARIVGLSNDGVNQVSYDTNAIVKVTVSSWQTAEIYASITQFGVSTGMV